MSEVKAPRRVAAHTLGCKVNQYETDAMLASLREAGYTVVPFDAEAEVYLINTCSVTGEAGRKSRQMIRRARRRAPGALVVAAGCHAELSADSLPADLCIGTRGKAEIAAAIESALGSRSVQTAGIARIHDEPRPDYEDFAPFAEQSETRAVVKIQDGCNRFCSYCIIPYARGRVRSRDEEAVLDEAQRLLAAGHQELVLTGIHLGSYGLERGEEGQALPRLLRRIDALPGLERLRLGSLDPASVDDALVSALADSRHACSHLHLSLQSGSDTVLARMRRAYDTEGYRAAAAHLRAALPELRLTTDVIVAFPGETEAEHRASLAFCREMGFMRMHVFRYSARPGTRAATMPDQLPAERSAARAAEMQALSDANWRAHVAALAGQRDELLIEERAGDGSLSGYGWGYEALRLVPAPAQSLPRAGLVAVRHLGRLDPSGERALVEGLEGADDCVGADGKRQM